MTDRGAIAKLTYTAEPRSVRRCETCGFAALGYDDNDSCKLSGQLFIDRHHGRCDMWEER